MADVADLSIGAPGAPEVEPNSDDKATDPNAPTVDAQSVTAPEATEKVVRSLLRGIGGTAGYALGNKRVAHHWEFTDKELDDLTPPLTRYINRNARLRVAVARGDEVQIAYILAGYAGRNLAADRVANEQARKEVQADANKSGETAPAADRAHAEGAGIPFDPRTNGGSGGVFHPTPGGGMG